MYCPKCSQQQVADEIRFCSRCGFQLESIKTLLAEDESSAASSETEAERGLTPARKRDMLLGATVMLVASIAIALLTISTIAGTPLLAVIIPLLLVWAALVSALLLSGHAVREVKRLFSKDASLPSKRTSSGPVGEVKGAARREALPPAQETLASGLGAWGANTSELAQPPSITEHTTNLLDKR